VIRRDLTDCCSRFLRTREQHDALTRRHDGRKPRVLHNRRSAGREIAGRAAAEPAWLPYYVPALRDAPLAFRGLDVSAIRIEIAAALKWIDDRPSELSQQVCSRQLARRFRAAIVARVVRKYRLPFRMLQPADGNFQPGRSNARRQVEKPHEFRVLLA